KSVQECCARLAARRPLSGEFSFPPRSRETDLPAQRATAEATARFSCAYGDACRPRDSQAQARKGPQAAVRVTPASMHKRNRLSRSRDFDSVSRIGRSTSTRFVGLYRFVRDGELGAPRPGLAVP